MPGSQFQVKRDSQGVAVVEGEPRQLKVKWADGFEHTFHPMWLRERSFDPSNKDPATGHRLEEVAFFPLDLSIDETNHSNGVVTLSFTDGHRTEYALDDLRAVAENPLPDDLIGKKRFWDGSLDPLPWFEFDELKEDAQHLLDLLSMLAELGFVLVRGTPAEADGLTDFTDLFGYIRYTNSGGVADVRSVAQAYDLSMTARGLEPHVDNPYRLPSPGYTFLHCVENSAEGGDSTLVDGFSVAERMRHEDPEAFRVLADTPVVFTYKDEQAVLESFGPFIELRDDGQYFRTRFHNRADQVVPADPEILERFYSARRRYAELIWSEEMSIAFKLAPGELYLADNYRVFHGRKPFNPGTGDRYMRQCYMDRDVMASRQKTLMQDITTKPWQPR